MDQGAHFLSRVVGGSVCSSGGVFFAWVLRDVATRVVLVVRRYGNSGLGESSIDGILVK